MRFKVEIYYDEPNNKVRFRMLEHYTYKLSYGPAVIVPKYFEHDFASVPRLLWGIIPSIGKHMNAAVLHDFLYDRRIGTRKQADMEFKRMMLRDGVHPIKAEVMYRAVRWFGGSWWRT